MADPIYNIKKFVSGPGYKACINIDGDDTDNFDLSWITWDFPDADNLHFVISDPSAEDDIEYTIPLTTLMIQGINYPDQATVDAALNILFPADPLTSVASDGITIGGNGTEADPLHQIDFGSS